MKSPEEIRVVGSIRYDERWIPRHAYIVDQRGCCFSLFFLFFAAATAAALPGAAAVSLG